MADFLTKLTASVPIGIALGTCLYINPARGADFDFNIKFFSGSQFGEISSGSFTVDDSFLATGNEIVTPQSGLTAFLSTIAGENFTAQDDSAFPSLPKVSFFNFKPVALDYQGDNGSANLSAFGTQATFTNSSGQASDGDLIFAPEPSRLQF